MPLVAADHVIWEADMKRTAFILAMLGTPAFADPGDFGHMMGWGYGMVLGPLLWLVVLALLSGAVIWIVRRIDAEAPRKSGSAALAELDLRLARGEIDVEEYGARKRALSA
jgi:putative membrane protein